MIPNTTPTPNELYNGEMKKMNDTELRVVLVVTRSTLGWEIDHKTGMRKQEDWISHTQLIKKSGRSSPAISRAVDICVKKGWIETRDKQGNLLTTPQERKRRRVYYRLGSIFLNKVSTKESLVDSSTKESKADENLPNLTTKSTKESKVDLPKKVRNTKETITKETKQILSATADEIYNSMNSSSGQKDRSVDIFSSKGIIEKMINDKQKHIQVVGIYWKWLDWSFENKEQYESALGRDLRAASALKGYSLARIKRTFKKLDGDSANGEKFAWNLNTVHKTIDNVK